MRIVLIVATSTGGVGRHVHDLAEGLVDKGHEVTVTGPPDVLAAFGYAALGARVEPLVVSDRPHPRHDVAAIRTLRRLLAGTDVVHAHGLRAGALAVLALGLGGPPLVVTLHNGPPEGPVAGAIHQALELVVSRGADLVLGVSADLVARMRRLRARATGLAVIPAAARPTVTKDRYAVRREFAAAPRVPLVVTIARLAPQKGLDVLLDALAQLRATGLEVVSVIAGEGPLAEPLAKRIRSEGLPVRLLGHRRDVPDLLAAADVVVSSSRWEGQPVALQEALHLGAAIVATDAGGTGAVVGDAAILVPVGDARSLASALADVLRHGSVRDDLRSKAMARAGELPTRADAIAAVLAAYDTVLRDHAGGGPAD